MHNIIKITKWACVRCRTFWPEDVEACKHCDAPRARCEICGGNAIIVLSRLQYYPDHKPPRSGYLDKSAPRHALCAAHATADAWLLDYPSDGRERFDRAMNGPQVLPGAATGNVEEVSIGAVTVEINWS